LSDLDVGITVGELLMGCFFVAVVWRLLVGDRDRGVDALRRDGGRNLYYTAPLATVGLFFSRWWEPV